MRRLRFGGAVLTGLRRVVSGQVLDPSRGLGMTNGTGVKGGGGAGDSRSRPYGGGITLTLQGESSTLVLSRLGASTIRRGREDGTPPALTSRASARAAPTRRDKIYALVSSRERGMSYRQGERGVTIMFVVPAQTTRKENMYEIRGFLFKPVSGDETS